MSRNTRKTPGRGNRIKEAPIYLYADRRIIEGEKKAQHAGTFNKRNGSEAPVKLLSWRTPSNEYFLFCVLT